MTSSSVQMLRYLTCAQLWAFIFFKSFKLNAISTAHNHSSLHPYRLCPRQASYSPPACISAARATVHSSVGSTLATRQTGCVSHSTSNTGSSCTRCTSSAMLASTATTMCPQPELACNEPPYRIYLLFVFVLEAHILSSVMMEELPQN